jgi:hypothetical protein
MSKPVILRAILNFSNPISCDITRLNNLLATASSLTMQKLYIIKDNTNLTVYSDDRIENIKLLNDFNAVILSERTFRNFNKPHDKE